MESANWLAYLDKLNDRNLKETLLQAGIIQHFDSGAELLRTGQFIRYVPIVLKGSLRVTRMSDNGRELLVYYIPPGESCIMTLLAIRQNSPSLVRAEADEPSEVLLLPLETFNQQIAGHRDWLDFTFALFRQRFESLLETVNDIAFSRMDERLLDLLTLRRRQTGNMIIHSTHQQLADDLGTAREVVTRLLKRLETEGKISTGRGFVKILKDL